MEEEQAKADQDRTILWSRILPRNTSKDCTGVTGLTRLSQAYPRNPVTGELALNGSTDKARLIACVAHVNVLYKPFNELYLANEKHARSNQHPTCNARSSAVNRTMMIDDDTIVRSKQRHWRPAMTMATWGQVANYIHVRCLLRY